jgi:hypothetical protein
VGLADELTANLRVVGGCDVTGAAAQGPSTVGVIGLKNTFARLSHRG